MGAFLTINKLIDNLSTLTFETFIKGSEAVILRQSGEIPEISTPAIRIWESKRTLPVIGTPDSVRMQIVMESLLG